jgi:glucosylceramidase
MNSRITSCLLLMAASLLPQILHAQNDATFWLTTPDKSFLFQLQPTSLQFGKQTGTNPTINVDDKQTFQTIDGFGFALTGGSAQLIMKMDPAQRAALLQELFADDGKKYWR